MIKLKIKELRISKGLTQQQLAQKANITQGFLSKLEKGVSREVSPTLVVLESICNALDVCIIALIGISCEYCNKPNELKYNCCKETVTSTQRRLKCIEDRLDKMED